MLVCQLGHPGGVGQEVSALRVDVRDLVSVDLELAYERVEKVGGLQLPVFKVGNDHESPDVATSIFKWEHPAVARVQLLFIVQKERVRRSLTWTQDRRVCADADSGLAIRVPRKTQGRPHP